MESDGQAFYLYCFAHPGQEPVECAIPFFTHSFMCVGAVLSMVPIEDFCGPAAEANLQNLAWVGPRACQHEHVIEKVMSHSPVFPARFGTIFLSLTSLEAFLQKHHDTILQFLDQQTDNEEWSVKGMLDQAKAMENRFSAAIKEKGDSFDSLPQGARYFQEKFIRNNIEKELKNSSHEICSKVIITLKSYAPVFCERKTMSRDVTGSGMDMIRNWAFVIPRNVINDFHDCIARANADYAHQGIVFELSGPWPPYSFCPSLVNQ